jgi:uncharacterized protein YkwD
MANRVHVVVLAAVVLASMVVGGLLGMQFAGGGGGDDALAGTPDATPSSTTPTPAPATTAPTPTPTATATPDPVDTTTPEPTPTATPTPTFSADSINTTTLETHLRAMVNERLRENGDPLRRPTAPELDDMAQFHSENMRAQGYADHTAGGYSTSQRYRLDRFDLYDRCRVPSDTNAGIRDGEELEVIGRISVDAGGDWTEEDLADRLVSAWADDATDRERLGLVNADRAGVGVAVSESGYVYATVDLC